MVLQWCKDFSVVYNHITRVKKNNNFGFAFTNELNLTQDYNFINTPDGVFCPYS